MPLLGPVLAVQLVDLGGGIKVSAERQELPGHSSAQGSGYSPSGKDALSI